MRIIKRSRLTEFWTKHPRAKSSLRAWYAEAKKASWKHLVDARGTFNSVDEIGDRLVFNIGGNNFRLVVRVKYPVKLLFVRWFGTHAEYDKIDVTKV